MSLFFVKIFILKSALLLLSPSVICHFIGLKHLSLRNLNIYCRQRTITLINIRKTYQHIKALIYTQSLYQLNLPRSSREPDLRTRVCKMELMTSLSKGNHRQRPKGGNDFDPLRDVLHVFSSSLRVLSLPRLLEGRFFFFFVIVNFSFHFSFAAVAIFTFFTKHVGLSYASRCTNGCSSF